MIRFLRFLLGLRSYEEDFNAGVTYVREQIWRHRNNIHEYNRLWAECDPGGIDRSGFDAGMREALRVHNIPHPMETEVNSNDLHDCVCRRLTGPAGN